MPTHLRHNIIERQRINKLNGKKCDTTHNPTGQDLDRLKVKLDQLIQRNKIPDTNWLNNFHGRFPGGYSVRGLTREDMAKRIWEDDPSSSHYLRTRTRGEFIEDCRRAVMDAGFKEDEPQKLWRRTYMDPNFRTWDFCEKMIPVVRRLLEMGYDLDDLTG